MRLNPSVLFGTWLRSAFLSILLLSLCREAAQAQAAAPARARAVLAANPLGFLQFGPTVEAEALAGQLSVATGVRIPTLGLLAHVIDPDIGFSWLLMGGVRLYLEKERLPAGWWAGPRFEWGHSLSAGERYTVQGWGLEIGHRWVRPNRRAIAAGAIAGRFESESGLTGKFIMGVISLGVVR